MGHLSFDFVLCAADIIAVDRSDTALGLAKECGAQFTVKADGNEVEAIMALTDGKGAEAVIDFVGEGNAIKTRNYECPKSSFTVTARCREHKRRLRQF